MKLPETFSYNADDGVLRLDFVGRLEDTLRRYTDTDAEFAEVLRDVALGDPLVEIADARFRPGLDGKYREGRYNKSEFPAFYVAEDESTAMQEQLHQQRVHWAASISSPVYFEFTNWHVRATGHDISEEVLNYPELIANEWRLCQAVGAQAVDQKAEILRVASARRKTGLNRVVFARNVVRSTGTTGRLAKVSWQGDTLDIDYA